MRKEIPPDGGITYFGGEDVHSTRFLSRASGRGHPVGVEGIGTHSEVTATLFPFGSTATQRMGTPAALATRPRKLGFPSSYCLTSESLLPDNQQSGCEAWSKVRGGRKRENGDVLQQR